MPRTSGLLGPAAGIYRLKMCVATAGRRQPMPHSMYRILDRLCYVLRLVLVARACCRENGSLNPFGWSLPDHWIMSVAVLALS